MASYTPIGISDINQTDNDTTMPIGDLRRAYGVPFSSYRLSRLNIDQDPMFAIVASKRNVPVADTHFKYFEERPMTWKRYVYVVGWKTWSGSGSAPTSGHTTNSADISTLTPQTAGSYMALKVGTDYMSSGNRGNIYGQSTNAVSVGATGTLPIFLLQNQVIKINTKSATGDYVSDDFFTARIIDVQTSGNYAYLGVVVIRPIKTATNKYLCSFTDGTTPISTTYSLAPGHDKAGTAIILETAKTYVIGNAWGSGTGLPGTFNDQPYYSRTGLTEIVKHTYSMDNSSMCIETKFERNEFARNWTRTVLDHKWDIGDIIYFGTQYEEDSGIRHTQGVVDWVINHGKVFSLTTSKTVDGFLEDFSTMFDPRYNPISGMLFVVSTYWWNFFHKLGGYALNNLKIGVTASETSPYEPTAHFTADFAFAGAKKIAGANIFEFSTLYGPMYVMRDVHLDSSPVKMLGLSVQDMAYRPLVGNGRNRDTTIYPGIQTLEKTGVDATTNLIMTEFGMEYGLPEKFAIWT